ncbi:MAG: radical SAM protein [Dehalococcoidales bacterium]|nr:radical SAM protein [Dehalococcoidales bacterium]
MSNKITIYLCDFVHDYLGVGTYMFPLNIGFVAAWANEQFQENVDIHLFKYPGDFMEHFKESPPDLVGFSNYTWNADLNNKVSEWVKSVSPGTIVIYGGPNINYSDQGCDRFFTSHDSTDFYVLFQGETPFENILRRVLDKGLSLPGLKGEAIEGVVFYDKDSRSTIRGDDIPRIKEVNTIPSPYLSGLLDKFFDTNLIPIVETNRGCPYQCTYCCQGLSSHNQLEFFSLKRVKEELSYIAHRTKNTNVLIFADANFGIKERDIGIAKYVAKLREETNYPRKLNVNWAKNQPKLFEISKILESSNMVISLQSLDDTVLKNIKRQNIKIPVFKEILDRINRDGGMSGTEIILGLPGETKDSHLKSIRQLFEWDVSYIICYNCLILEGSELSLAREEGEFECQTKFRLVDNSYGEYDGIMSFESEEGTRSIPTMTEDEILYFRPVHWLIQFLWNYRFYYDLLKYLKSTGINPLDYIIALLDNVDTDAPEEVRQVFREFKEDAKAEWFDTAEALQQHYAQPDQFDWLTQGNYGKMNSKYIFKVLTEARKGFEDYLYKTALRMRPDKKDVFETIMAFLSTAIIDFRKDDDSVFKDKAVSLSYNILKWREDGYCDELTKSSRSENGEFLLYVPEEQKESLKILLKQYEHSNKNVTLRKMSEFMDIRDFFRKVKPVA